MDHYLNIILSYEVHELRDQTSAMVNTSAASDYSRTQEKCNWLLRLMQVQGLWPQPQNFPPSFFGVRTSTTFMPSALRPAGPLLVFIRLMQYSKLGCVG